MKNEKKYHKCEEWKNFHKVKFLAPDDHSEHGSSINKIINYNNEKYWWASCNEYATMIQYCPFCGINLINDEL